MTSQICALLDNIPRGVLSSTLTENGVRVDVLRILILSDSYLCPTSRHDQRTAIESLRNVLFKVLSSETDGSEMREAAHLVLKLESRMETVGYLVVGNHHLDSLLQFVDKQLHSPLNPRPDWHEESIEHTLIALGKSTRGDEAQLWEKGIIRHLGSASGADHSAGVRRMALRIVGRMDFDKIWATPGNIGTISSFLRDFWEQLPPESQITYAKSYAGALSSFSKVTGAHPLIFRDHWKSSEVIIDQELEGSQQSGFELLQNIHDGLPVLIRESGNMDASRAWLAMARRTPANYLKAASLAKIEEAAAEVLGFEAGRVEEVSAASVSQS
jgi:hypothetical protein